MTIVMETTRVKEWSAYKNQRGEAVRSRMIDAAENEARLLVARWNVLPSAFRDAS